MASLEGEEFWDQPNTNIALVFLGSLEYNIYQSLTCRKVIYDG